MATTGALGTGGVKERRTRGSSAGGASAGEAVRIFGTGGRRADPPAGRGTAGRGTSGRGVRGTVGRSSGGAGGTGGPAPRGDGGAGRRTRGSGGLLGPSPPIVQTEERSKSPWTSSPPSKFGKKEGRPPNEKSSPPSCRRGQHTDPASAPSTGAS